MAQDVRNVAENLATQMELRNVTAQKLSTDSGVHWTQISRIIRKHCLPKWDTIERLAAGLKVPIEVLLLDPPKKSAKEHAKSA